MGTCASVYTRSECSAVKSPAPPESMTDKFEIPPSPIKHFKLQNKTDSAIKDISVISNHHKTPSGSKEEAFFDSRAWLDSDCEDFFSVKGDFTPSCGNTPLHHRFPAETPRTSKVGADNEPSTFNSPPLSTKRRKKLVDLFRESLGNDASFAFLNHDDNRKADEPCLSGTDSVCDSERTGSGGDENPIGFESKLCCLPPLVSRNSSRERKEDLKVVNGVS
ncbi:uncharacterized protein At3g27210-like [Benincasa hispida]|uniref:uncharacterized protein At3g27210-like n=1 Tax=Benincasa hispida TaxID=102211 RepID=UPI0018FF59D6|nr:uncharacterized protein At3g27210-like [Benincasa hispida]